MAARFDATNDVKSATPLAQLEGGNMFLNAQPSIAPAPAPAPSISPGFN